ncbi:MAG: translation initiation factor [Deltaproteobacteria bacterium]
MAKKKRERVDASTTAPEKGPFNNAFGGLASLRAQMGGASKAAETPAPVAADEPEATRGSGRKVVVARERKGRGGKTVTRVSQLDLDAAATETLAHTLKRTLGCGGSVEGEDVILAGDQTERAADWLRGELGRKVVIGN